MRLGIFKIGKSKEVPDRDAAAVDDSNTRQVADHINKRTKNLKAAEQQLIELSDTANDPEKEEDATPRPHKPLAELTIEPEEAPVKEEAEAVPA